MSRLTALVKTFGRITQQIVLALSIISIATPLQAMAATARISEAIARPAALGHAAGEWVEVQNLTSSNLSLDGWTLSDDSNTFAFPNGSTVPASGVVLICRGTTATAFPSGSATCDFENSGLVLGNSTEVITLKNNSDDTVDSMSIDSSVGTNQRNQSTEKNADGSLSSNSEDIYEVVTNSDSTTTNVYGTPGVAEDISVDAPEHLAPADASTQSSGTINFDWSDVTDPATPVTYNFEVSTSPDTDTDGSFTTVIGSASNTPSSEASTTTPGNDTYYWHVQAVDNLGNNSEWTAAWSVNVEDTDPPVTETPLYSPADNSSWIDSQIYISGKTGDDNSGVDSILIYARLAGTDDAYMLVKTADFAGAKHSSECFSSCDWSTWWDPATEPSPDGFPGVDGQAVFDIKVAGIDKAGNEESSAYAYDVLWDTEAPDLPDHISPKNNAYINHMNPTLVWEDVSDSDVSPPVCYYIQISLSNEVNDYNNGFVDPIDYTVVCDDNKVDVNVPDGINTFYWQVMACDSAYYNYSDQLEVAYIVDEKESEYRLGHCTDWTDPWRINIDKTAPVITVDKTSSTNHTRALSGTVNDSDAKIKVTVLGKTYTATNNGDGTWSLPPITFTPCDTHGVYDVTAKATDMAGNVGVDKTSGELEIIDIPGCDGVDHFYVSGGETGDADVDSDGDGFTDAEEIDAGTNPNDPDDFPGSDEDEKKDDEGVEGESDESTFEYRWLILIAAVIAFLWFLLRRREEDEEGAV